jgi:hypothetical protein
VTDSSTVTVRFERVHVTNDGVSLPASINSVAQTSRPENRSRKRTHHLLVQRTSRWPRPFRCTTLLGAAGCGNLPATLAEAGEPPQGFPIAHVDEWSQHWATPPSNGRRNCPFGHHDTGAGWNLKERYLDAGSSEWSGELPGPTCDRRRTPVRPRYLEDGGARHLPCGEIWIRLRASRNRRPESSLLSPPTRHSGYRPPILPTRLSEADTSLVVMAAFTPPSTHLLPNRAGPVPMPSDGFDHG